MDEPINNTPTPYGKKMQKPTDRPHDFLWNLKEKLIMRYLFSSIDTRFNLRQFAKINNLNRTTLIDDINRLIRNGYIEKLNAGSYKITQKGKDTISMIEGCRDVSESLRRGCRKEQLSTHYFKYQLKIKSIDRNRLEELNAKEIKENKLSNFTEYYLYYDDCTLCIKLNKIIIHIHDLITDNIDDALEMAFNKAIAYTFSIKKIGEVDGLSIFEKAHFARVESYLSNKLSKIDNKYSLVFQDGSKFWIDYSDKREDETDNPLYRERIDEIFIDAKASKSVFSDVDRHSIEIDKMKEIALIQLQTMQGLVTIHTEELIPKKKEDIYQTKIDNNYFG